MKKLFCLVLAALMPFAFAISGCGQDEDIRDSYETPSEDTEEESAFEEFYAVKESGGEQYNIYCRLYLPENSENKSPAVILSHSSSMTADSMNSYALGFAERGFVAVAFDFCGGSSSGRSDGDAEDMTVFTEMDDLKAVFDAVRNFDFVDDSEIYLFGTSQGGLVSALTANDMPDEVAGLILLYPAFNIPELARTSESGSIDWIGIFGDIDWSAFLENIDWSVVVSSGGLPSVTTGEAFTSTLADFDAYENIGNFTGKVLILHGSEDFIVNKSYSERAQLVYADCELHIIDGAFHGFNEENYGILGNYDDVVWEYVDAFLN